MQLINHVPFGPTDRRDMIKSMHDAGILNPSTFQVLERAAQHGGFIAGGFAATVAKICVCTMPDGKLPGVIVRDYLGRFSKKEYVRNRKAIKTNVGDIDVWFQTPEGAQSFLRSIHESPISQSEMQDTPAGFGKEIACYESSGGQALGQLVQVITRYIGTPAEVTSSFDIYNAACYIHNGALFVPENWDWLYKHKLVHVHVWKETYGLQRISKWMHKHGYYNGLTPASKELINEQVPILLSNIADKKLKNYHGVPYTERSFTQSYIRRFIHDLSPENLLKISMHYPDRAYNEAMHELVKRMEQSLGKHKPVTASETDIEAIEVF